MADGEREINGENLTKAAAKQSVGSERTRPWSRFPTR